MGDVTAIGWTDHSFNGWWGGAHISPGCANCYAHAWALRWGHDVFHLRGPRRMLSDRNWDRPRAWNRAAELAGVPTRAFAFSMGDVFEDHPALPEPRARFFALAEETPWVTWQILTKRIEHVAGMVPWAAGDWPANVHLGTSAENQELAEERVPVLAALDGPAVRFVSAEPLLSPVDLSRWLPRLGWVVTGGESGADRREMDPAWLESVAGQCQAAGVPVFVKQDSGPRPGQQGRIPDATWGLKQFPPMAVPGAA